MLGLEVLEELGFLEGLLHSALEAHLVVVELARVWYEVL